MLEAEAYGDRATEDQADSRHLVGPAGLEMGLGTGAVHSRLGVMLQAAQC